MREQANAETCGHPFEGLEARFKRQRELRFQVVERCANLDRAYIENELVGEPNWSRFITKLVDLYKGRQKIHSDVLQSLIDLRNGMEPNHVAVLLAELHYISESLTEQGMRRQELDCVPPDECLKSQDAALYDTSLELHGYLTMGGRNQSALRDKYV